MYLISGGISLIRHRFFTPNFFMAGTVIFNEVVKYEHMFLIIGANRDINELGKKR